MKHASDDFDEQVHDCPWGHGHETHLLGQARAEEMPQRSAQRERLEHRLEPFRGSHTCTTFAEQMVYPTQNKYGT